MPPAEVITIRKATLDDAEGILECLRSAFAPYRHQYSANAFEDTVLTHESFAGRLGEMAVFAAIDQSGRVVGTIACKVIGKADGHLRGMAVRPDSQARGIATRLLARAEAQLVDQKCSRISLDTTEPLHRAMRFYERHGFHRSGKVRDFFGMPLIEYVKVVRENRRKCGR
jgi:N-acetylglutamate synthase-like GNAT family acetyltransferase